jgi:hypothetical protein
MPATNLLAMPLVELVVDTGTNEDWVDSIKYLVGDGGSPETFVQLDIRGISFEMEVRRAPPNHEVIISASSANGMLVTGTAPDYGYLLINIPNSEMKNQTPSTGYVADIVGTDAEHRRRVVTISLTISEGITR